MKISATETIEDWVSDKAGTGADDEFLSQDIMPKGNDFKIIAVIMTIATVSIPIEHRFESKIYLFHQTIMCEIYLRS